MKKFPLIILTFLVHWSLIAEVIVPPGFISDTLWTKANSPYRIAGNVTVHLDSLLTIEPGIEVLFQGDFRFEVDGILIANGFYSDSIIFRPYTGNTSGWQGIWFNNDSLNSEMSYCKIDSSNGDGVRVNDTKSPQISNCTFQNNFSDGIFLRRSEMDIYNCRFQNNNSNGIIVDNGVIRITNSILTRNAEAGIFSVNSQDSIYVTNCVIAHNSGTGISALPSYLEVLNSIIYYNGIDIASPILNRVITYSDIGDESINGTGVIHQDPDFTNDENYYINPNSQCRNAGNDGPNYYDLYFPPSLKGDRNDMGAYGGPFAGNWFPPLFINPDSLDFGQVSYDSSVTLTLNVKNYRDIPINIESIEFTGNDTSAFNVSFSNLTINVRDSAYLDVIFTPDAETGYTSELEFETTEFGNFNIPVFGNGIVAEISSYPTNLFFGYVNLGTYQDSVITIYNTGSDTLRLNNLYTDSSEFYVNRNSFNINPSSWDTIVVSFTPNSTDEIIDTLFIINNDHNEGEFRIPLKGQGYGPIINLDSSAYNFGSVLLTSDSSLSINIRNNGNDSLFIDSIQIADNDSNTFRLLIDTLAFIEPDSNSTLEIVFEPLIMGLDSAELRILSDDAFNPIITRSLFGTGVAPIFGITDTLLNFGEIPFNTISMDSILITNSGNIDLIINPDSLIITGDNPEYFNIDSVGSYDITDGESNYIYISFNAVAEGEKLADLQIVTNDPFNPKKYLQLRGETHAPNISISTGLLDFGNVLKDSIAYQSLYLYNTGLGELVIYEDSLSFDEPDSSYFSVDRIEKSVIEPNDTSFIRISFEAQKPAVNLSGLNIISNDPDSHHVSIDLEAFVLIPFIHLPQTSIDFGTIPIATQIQKSIIIYNVGYDNLTIYQDSLEFLGTGAQFFSIDSVVGDTIIQQDDSLQLLLRFSADETGTKSATLIIRSDDQVLSVVPVNLTGSSATPQIELSNSSLDFGIVPATTDTSLKLIIYNLGQGNLILYKDGFELSGSDTLSFNVPSLNSDTTIIPQDSLVINIDLNTNDVGPKSAQLKIESNDLTKMVDLTGLVIDNEQASVSIDTQHSNVELIYHQNGNLRFNVSTNFPTDSVELNYRQGGAEVFQSEQCTDLQQMNLWEITIDSSWITSKGFEYFVRIFHGWTFTDWPAKPKSLQVKLDNVEFPLMTQKEVYQKISIPFITSNQSLNTLFSDNLGSYDNTQYRIFDCENGVDYTEITNLEKELPPGKSLWLITKDEVALDFNNAKTLPTDTTFKLSLQIGWNMVANPFAFPINWDENVPDRELRFYDGTNTWPVVTVMEPFKGYAVKDSFASEIFLEPKEYTGFTSFPKVNLFNEYNWSINLKVEQNKLQDHFNIAGSKNNALVGIDKYDYEEPPPIGNYVGLYFLLNNETTSKTEKFSTDIKDESLDGQIFDFEVNGNVSGKKNLIVEPNSLPEDFNYVIVNTQSKIKYQSNNIELYSSTNKLQLMVGTEEFVNSHTVDYNFVPSSFKLEQNYPNPFNPVTTINYELPKFSILSINIYNILGQKVRSLLKNVEKDAGYYKIKWDGRNEFGNAVATGLYVLNFRSGQFTKSIKMILQR